MKPLRLEEPLWSHSIRDVNNTALTQRWFWFLRSFHIRRLLSNFWLWESFASYSLLLCEMKITAYLPYFVLNLISLHLHLNQSPNRSDSQCHNFHQIPHITFLRSFDWRYQCALWHHRYPGVNVCRSILPSLELYTIVFKSFLLPFAQG